MHLFKCSKSISYLLCEAKITPLIYHAKTEPTRRTCYLCFEMIYL